MKTAIIAPVIALHKAEYEIAKHNYSRAFKLLLPYAVKFKSHYYYLYLLGIAAYGKGDYNNSYDYFQSAIKLTTSPAYEVKLYLALLALVSNNSRRAIEYWLEVSDSTKHPKHKYIKYAQKALIIMRDSSDNTQISQKVIKNPYKYAIVPEISYPYKRAIFILKICGISLASALLIFAIVTSVMFFKNQQTKIERGQKRREVMQNIRSDLKTSAQIINIFDYPQYTLLAPNAISEILEDLEQKFILYNDNLAQVYINTILYSNALPKDKNKVLLMEKSLGNISFASLVEWYSYKTVISEIWKYNDVSVRWKGTITKIRQNAGNIEGQFLVGFYGDNKELDGVVSVSMPNYMEAYNGDELEMLGKINVNHDILTQNNNKNTDKEIAEKNDELQLHFLLQVSEFRYLISKNQK